MPGYLYTPFFHQIIVNTNFKSAFLLGIRNARYCTCHRWLQVKIVTHFKMLFAGLTKHTSTKNPLFVILSKIFQSTNPRHYLSMVCVCPITKIKLYSQTYEQRPAKGKLNWPFSKLNFTQSVNHSRFLKYCPLFGGWPLISGRLKHRFDCTDTDNLLDLNRNISKWVPTITH